MDGPSGTSARPRGQARVISPVIDGPVGLFRCREAEERLNRRPGHTSPVHLDVTV
ncbi:hypothetical protein ABZY02_18975 [Streptomyces sp. NPDC006649]|uniref:hypothetical protein n=1 Tax=Streptomyces sp. NPDC006649 TaxID=3156896 RepID=UPI00339FD817